MQLKNTFKHFIMTLAFFMLITSPTYAAAVGDVLTQPEDGWTRIEATKDNHFEYPDIMTEYPTNKASGGHMLYTKTEGLPIKFKFKGTQLRLITLIDAGSPSKVEVILDGQSEFISLADPDFGSYQRICYEKLNLEDKVHEVTMVGFPSHDISVSLDAIDINEGGQIVGPGYVDPIILDIEPEKTLMDIYQTVTADLTINNISEIAAEDILIEYDQSKLEFQGFEELDGLKLVHSVTDENNGTLRVIIASRGESNIIDSKETLLKLKFKAIGTGEALIDITKAKVTDGIVMEKSLLAKECDQAIINIEGILDVNNSGAFTLLDLGIDARHFSKDPSLPELAVYNTDLDKNNAIDDLDLLEISKKMMANSDYSL